MVQDIAAALRTSPVSGLDEEEAARRLTVDGANEIEAAPAVSPLRLLLEQFQNLLILILLVGAGLSAALGHRTEAIVITVIVVFAALLGFVQEYRAERPSRRSASSPPRPRPSCAAASRSRFRHARSRSAISSG